jgi:hypothetical protein
MASATKLIAALFGLERVGGTSFLMALVAHLGDNRLMHVIVQYPGHIRAVRVVAAGAT